MDAAAPTAKLRRDSPLIPPNYVSLRHLQELRLKEKERQRRLEEAAVGGVKEVAEPEPDTKARLDASCGAKERYFGGKQWVAVAHQLPPPPPPPPRGEGAAKKRDRAIGDRRCMKGSDDAAASASQGGGGKAENKEKRKISAGTKGELVEPATASSHGGKPGEKMKGKGKVSGDQSTTLGTSGGPVEQAEAAGAPSRGRVRPENKRKGKKGSGVRSAGTVTTRAPAEPADASPPQDGKSDNKGKKKPSVGRRADAAPSSDSPDGERAQPPPVAEGSSNWRSVGGHRTTTGEVKSEGLGEKQPVVEVKGAAERKPRVVRSSAGQRRPGGRGHGTARQHGKVWVPKEEAAAAAPGLSGVAGF